MKRFIMAIIVIMAVALIPTSGFSYTTISGSEAYEIFSSNEALIVVDVRENYEYCPYHIPCAKNYPLNSGVFSEEYSNLPTDAPILVVCASGHRSSRAAAILSGNGYETVYSLSGGISSWPETLVSCDDDGQCSLTPIYFPHIASGNGWETEIAIINLSLENPLSGTFKTYNAAGDLLDESKTLNLPAAGRSQLIVGNFFENANNIRYIIFATDSNTVYGYLKFYNSPGISNQRVAIPAPTRVNQDIISISHIATTGGWWTGLGMVNTSNESRELTFTFNNGQSKNLTMSAGAYEAVQMETFLEGLLTEEINSAIITNAEGIVGLEIFGNANQLSGVLLRDTTTQSLYYPHIASDENWWTGIVAFNPGLTAGELTVKPYAEDGTLLSPAEPATPDDEALRLISPPEAATPIDIGSRKRFIGSASQLNLPEGTAWMAIESTVPVSGFELFGTLNGLQLAGYTSVGIDGYSGVFAKQENAGWSGVALVNTTDQEITVTLNAYNDSGSQIATVNLPLNGHQRVVGPPEELFTEDIESATYISYSATAPVVAFQLNGSGNMLDALPGRQ